MTICFALDFNEERYRKKDVSHIMCDTDINNG